MHLGGDGGGSVKPTRKVFLSVFIKVVIFGRRLLSPTTRPNDIRLRDPGNIYDVAAFCCATLLTAFRVHFLPTCVYLYALILT